MEPLKGRLTRAARSLRSVLPRLTEPLVLFPLLAVILLGVLWVGTASLIGVRRENARRSALTSTAELLDTYEAQVVRSLHEIDSTLELLQLEAEGGPGSISLAELEARGLLPPSLIFTVTVLDPTGAPIDSTAPGGRGGLPGPEELTAAHAADELVIGRPVEDLETGGWLLHFIRPLRDADGSFIGSATVAVASAYFVSGYEEDALGRRGVLALLGADGVFLARRTGTTVSAGEEIEDLAVPSADGGVALVRNPWDGVVRYTASRELFGFPVAVLVGMAAEEVLAPAERDVRAYRARAATAGVVLVAVLALLGRMSWRLQRARQREQRARLEHAERMQHLADHDSLTDLPNRNLFSRVLQQATREAARYERRMAILFIDLDRFKEVNDTLGHDVGDELLQEVARRLRRCLRESDTVARLGGDEFMVLLPQIDAPRAAEAVADKILVELGRPFLLRGQEYRISGSIGISLFPQDGRDEQTLTRNADTAMYQAKGEGKNTFRYYSEEMTTRSLERLALESRLRQALEEGEFRLQYQAKRSARTGEVTGVEALLRWEPPEMAPVPPMRFLAVAEETGLIVPIGRWVLRTACRQLADWRAQGLPRLRVSVNLSPRQLFDPGLVRDVGELLEGSGVDPGLLELEIGESLVMRDVPGTRRVLRGLKALGVRIAVDEFGFGYSELARLERYPLDAIKIDRSFIHHVSEESGRMADALVSLGRSLSVTVVGQGVESDEQAEFLRVHGCDELQGFHVHRPMWADELGELLRRGEVAASADPDQGREPRGG